MEIQQLFDFLARSVSPFHAVQTAAGLLDAAGYARLEEAGYWNLFSFNPALKAEGKNPFTLTSKEGDGSYQAFLANETRYSSLTRKFPERAKVLFDRNEEAAKARFEHLQKLIELYK